MLASAILSTSSASYAMPCGSDNDCPGDLVCEKAYCVSPEAVLTPEQAEQARAAQALRAAEAAAADARRAQEQAAAEARAVEERERARKLAIAEAARLDEERAARAEAKRKHREEVAKARRPMRLVGYGLLAGAGASLVATTIFGLSAISSKSDLETMCLGAQCPNSAAATYDSMNSAATLSTVFFVTTTVLVVSSLIVFSRAAKIGAPAAASGASAILKPITSGLGGTF